MLLPSPVSSQELCEAALPLVNNAADFKTSSDGGALASAVASGGAFGGGWRGVLATLQRLEAAAIGSLAVAHFKVPLGIS